MAPAGVIRDPLGTCSSYHKESDSINYTIVKYGEMF